LAFSAASRSRRCTARSLPAAPSGQRSTTTGPAGDFPPWRRDPPGAAREQNPITV